MVVEAMAFASVITQGISVEALIPSYEPGLVEESAQTERVGESIPIPTGIPSP